MSAHLRIVFYFFLASLLIPWFWLQANRSMNTDIAWLVTGAGRILDGGTMSEDVYDTNPPLSLIVYMPPALAHRMTGIPLEHAVFGYTVLMVLVSSLAVRRIASGLRLTEGDGVDLLTATYVISNTILTDLDFGQKDHYLSLGLFPFFMIQAGMILRPGQTHPLRWPVCLAGSIAVLIKPYYIVIPATMMAIRLLRTKDIRRFIRDPDVLSAIMMTLLYALVTGLFFMDFVTVVLPDILILYMPIKGFFIYSSAFKYAIFTFSCFAASIAAAGYRGSMVFPLFCLAGAVLSLIAYLLQLKGFEYHLIPWTVFVSAGLFLSVHEGYRRRIAPNRFLPFFLTGAALALALIRAPLRPGYPTADDYRDFELTKRLQACGPSCTFFMYNENMSIIYPTSIHADIPHQSRFPTFWFAPLIERNGNTGLRNKFAGYVVEDFEKHRPDIVFICEKKPPFDFYSFMTASPRFPEVWKNYAYDSTLTINRRDYYRNTVGDYDHLISFKVYVRLPVEKRQSLVPDDRKP